ncbi:MAG: RAMP superfamily CRISPR-associated protein [Campylobacterota bacterium]|nr:RAMP superfamily CRISPR-associated protein [Campylobacterota bacterium]
METRHIAHIIIEADTPLKVGSNASDFLQDSPIQKDFNGLPMILGTSLAGVLRKDFDKGLVNEIFGKENGSKVIISNALLLDEKGKVSEELLLEKTKFLKIFDNLPIREHTAITEKGVAREHSKFDEEVLYKGSHFKFSIELIESDKIIFNEILDLLLSSSFRLGGGSTKGFGKIKIIDITTQSFTKDDYETYSSSLNHPLKGETRTSQDKKDENYINYTLHVEPEDFFMFGSGFGDSDADATPVYERVIDYENAKLKEEQILIPASSIKGALAHRTAFHFNKEMLKQGKDHTKVAEENKAVLAIFGHKKELNEENKELGQKGKILISDCFKEIKKDETKTFDHVSIDRFTGGAIDGALFNEKTIALKDKWDIEILLHVDITGTELQAFESALTDITTGMLPLGGMTTKGHGAFVGTLLNRWRKI